MFSTRNLKLMTTLCVRAQWLMHSRFENIGAAPLFEGRQAGLFGWLMTGADLFCEKNTAV